MKRVQYVTILIIFTCFCFTQCKKNKLQSPANIVGQWRWIENALIYPSAAGGDSALTPANTGKQELFVFNIDNTWTRTINNIISDSGTYTTGQGTYTTIFNITYRYDSIKYYHNGIPINGGVDYFEIHNNDTLQVSVGFAGQLGSCYSTMPYNGSKFWVKQ